MFTGHLRLLCGAAAQAAPRWLPVSARATISRGSRRSSTVHHLVTVAGDIAWLPQIRAVRNATTVVSANDSWPQSCWFRPRCRGAAAARISRVRSKAAPRGHCRDRCRDRYRSQAQDRSRLPAVAHPDRHRRRRAHRRPPPVRLLRPPSHRAPRRRPRQRPLRPPPPGSPPPTTQPPARHRDDATGFASPTGAFHVRHNRAHGQQRGDRDRE